MGPGLAPGVQDDPEDERRNAKQGDTRRHRGKSSGGHGHPSRRLAPRWTPPRPRAARPPATPRIVRVRRRRSDSAGGSPTVAGPIRRRRPLVTSLRPGSRGSWRAVCRSPASTCRSPKPRIVFAAPLPAGIAAEHELMEVFLVDRRPVAEVRDAIARAMPPGHELLDIRDAWLGEPALAGQVAAADYRIRLRAIGAQSRRPRRVPGRLPAAVGSRVAAEDPREGRALGLLRPASAGGRGGGVGRRSRRPGDPPGSYAVRSRARCRAAGGGRGGARGTHRCHARNLDVVRERLLLHEEI